MNARKPPQRVNMASIFGQIEEVVARKMAQEDKLRIIPVEQFPPIFAGDGQDIRFNEAGVPAKFAVIWSRSAEAEFDRRVAALRV